jgi:hypothetical protein
MDHLACGAQVQRHFTVEDVDPQVLLAHPRVPDPGAAVHLIVRDAERTEIGNCQALPRQFRSGNGQRVVLYLCPSDLAE